MKDSKDILEFIFNNYCIKEGDIYKSKDLSVKLLDKLYININDKSYIISYSRVKVYFSYNKKVIKIGREKGRNYRLLYTITDRQVIKLLNNSHYNSSDYLIDLDSNNWKHIFNKIIYKLI